MTGALIDQPLDRVTKRINKIGCGNSQIFTCLIAVLVGLCDGQEMLVMSLISLRLKDVWKLTPIQEGTLGSCVFAGVLFGSIFAGGLADKYGRRTTLISFQLILAICGLLSSIAPAFTYLIIIRTLAGFGLGGIIPTISCVVSECVPDKSRAITMLLVGMGFTVGECVTALEAMFLNVNLGSNWRWLLAISAAPAFISVIITMLYLDESPRYLNAIGEKEECDAILNKMERQNKLPLCCSFCCCYRNEHDPEENKKVWEGIDNLENDDNDDNDEFGSSARTSLLNAEKKVIKDLNNENDETNVSSEQSCCENNQLVELFESARPLDTIMIWIIFAVNSTIFYGLIWIFPITLKEGGGQEDNTGVSSKVLYGALAELPSVIIPLLVIDWLGRRGTIRLAYTVCIPMAVACAFLAPNLSSGSISRAFFWCVMGLKCTIAIAFSVGYIFAAEYVPSSVRGFAIGMSSATARLGGIATPYAMVLFHRTYIGSPYWFIAGACILGFIATWIVNEVSKHMR
jgi:MFS family permease